MSLVYTINGIPIPLARHRFSRRGNAYDSQKQLKMVVGISLRNIHEGRPLYNGPLHLKIAFIFPWHHNPKKPKPYWHTARPDLDNLVKLICDVGNTIIWEDDKQICRIALEKRYGDNPRTEFTVHPLDPFSENEIEFEPDYPCICICPYKGDHTRKEGCYCDCKDHW